jgi:hypothetical protein
VTVNTEPLEDDLYFDDMCPSIANATLSYHMRVLETIYSNKEIRLVSKIAGPDSRSCSSGLVIAASQSGKL